MAEEVNDDPLAGFAGHVHTGTLLEVKGDDVLFALEDEETKAAVPRDEFPELPDEGAGLDILLDDQLEPGLWRGSVHGANALKLWDEMKQRARSGEIVEALVVNANDGGLVVDVGIRGFVPRSQVDLHKVDDLESFIGQTDRFKVDDFDERRGEVILSRRAVLEQGRKEEKAKLLESLEPGQTYTGVVRNVLDYGAFVDIGGLEGLLHKSNMTWGRLDNAKDRLSPGDEIEVKVLDYDPKSEKLSLGRKQLTEDPWLSVTDQFEAGQKVKGAVVSLARFGAFVEIAPGIEGLVHNSELSWTERNANARKLLEKDQEVEVLIVDIDPHQRRLRLSIKRLEGDPWQDLADKYSPGDKISGKVVRFADFGVFVELAPNIDGLLHASDISWTESRVEDLEERFEKGQELELVLLEIDPAEGKASLGLKQLEGDPWDDALKKAIRGEKIDVTINRIEPYGAFAEVVPGVDGLIHISELSEERVNTPEQVVKQGQEVSALVINVDKKKRRIGLSLKRDHLEDGDAAEYHDEGEATTGLGALLKEAGAQSDED